MSQGELRGAPVTPPGWAVEAWLIDGGAVSAFARTWRFPDFASALAFVNTVGAVAEAQQHHPWVELTWGRVTLRVWTHDAQALTEQDTRLCEAINELG